MLTALLIFQFDIFVWVQLAIMQQGASSGGSSRKNRSRYATPHADICYLTSSLLLWSLKGLQAQDLLNT